MLDCELEKLKEQGEAPKWMQEVGLAMLRGGYLLDGETPKEMYWRSSYNSAQALGKPELAPKFFELMWENILCLASPVAANMGLDRALPISCYGIHVPDSMHGIGDSNLELMMLTKSAGGVGINYRDVRGRGSPIQGGMAGHSEGTVPWMKINDSSILASKQANTRKGAVSFNVPVTHPDIHEFLKIRRAQGDINRQCLNSNHCVQISDDWMKHMLNGDYAKRELWLEIMTTRLETGEPYIHWTDNTNKTNPLAYRKNNLNVSMTNICTEIMLHTDFWHSFVCCLSSLNLFRWHKIKPEHIKLAIYFLDGVMQTFLNKAEGKEGFQRSWAGAFKGRPLGLGVLGWHSLLQRRMLPFDTSMDVMRLNAEVFRTIKKYAEEASKELAQEYGEPEWCKGTGMRNSHLMAVAPTVSNSRIAGGFSAGVEPITANMFLDEPAKGTFVYKNECLRLFLEEKGKNTKETWDLIREAEGSVSQLSFMSEHEKTVFLTAREMSQMNIITQAAQRQRFIDQAQSINLFFPANVNPKYFHEIHVKAWELGLKSLYYVRSGSVLKGDQASRYYEEECLSCDG